MDNEFERVKYCAKQYIEALKNFDEATEDLGKESLPVMMEHPFRSQDDIHAYRAKVERQELRRAELLNRYNEAEKLYATAKYNLLDAIKISEVWYQVEPAVCVKKDENRRIIIKD
jgi:hypothetical protein